MKLSIPQNIKYVLDTLISNGHKAYIVGGCVRDLLCGKTPNDYDVTTSALPNETQAIFKKTIATGIKHGTITVMVDNSQIEVTTFRTEDAYSDNRHPKSVNFIADVKDDLARRDFTVNAMCYNESEGLIDLFGGQCDINNKILRAVGDAETRFKEDALRILRLFRFAATTNFDIENNTFSAAIKCAQLLSNISAERIFVELSKATLGSNVGVISPLLKTDALNNYCLKDANLDAINSIENNPDLRLFAFINLATFDIGQTLNALKCSNKFKDYCTKMHDLINNDINCNKIDIKRALNHTDYNVVLDALNYLKHVLNRDVSKHLITLDEIIKNREPYKISHLNISGKDITSIGFKGEQVGQKLDFLLQEVIKNPELNTKDKLLNLICN